MQKKSIFMVGMPSSGKSTYLAALCRLLLRGQQETQWKLDAQEIPEGLENIRDLIKQLDSYQVVDRTIDLIPYNIQIPLFQKQQKIEFIVPDVSGEIFRDLVYDRRIKRTIVRQIEEADTLLFFVNVDTMVPEIRLEIQTKSVMKQVEEEHGKTEGNSEGDLQEHHGKLEERLEKTAGAQTLGTNIYNQSAVVELLQCIAYLVKGQLKVKFVVSAWDLVVTEYGKQVPSPQLYIKEKLPLLYQYAASNTGRLFCEYWGVSAQGGNFDEPEEVKKLQEQMEDDLSYIVTSEGEISKDLTKLL